MPRYFLLFFLCSALSTAAQKQQKSLDEAISLATAANKKIVLVLTGSEWCVPCTKMKKNVSSKEAYIQLINTILFIMK